MCYQRGMVPLHSAAIDRSDGCIALVGYSRAGKSTLAAVLSARGHQVLADDVTFLDRGHDGTVMAWPGISRIRLWEDAVTALGWHGPGVEREFRGYNKYLIPLSPPSHKTTSRQLRRIYQLVSSPVGAAPVITEVRGASAIEILMQSAYASDLAECMGQKPAVFALCSALARQVQVFRFSRPLGFDLINEGVDLLEVHLSQA
jgi:hypothetical protein